MTDEEIREANYVKSIILSLELCSKCGRVTECEQLPYLPGNWCADCVYSFAHCLDRQAS